MPFQGEEAKRVSPLLGNHGGTAPVGCKNRGFHVGWHVLSPVIVCVRGFRVKRPKGWQMLGLAAQATPDSANAFPLRLLKQPGSQMLANFLGLLVSATAYHACPSAPTAAVATLLAGCDVLSSPAETS